MIANRSGLGQQWPVSEPGTVEPYEVNDQQAADNDTLQIVRIAALYTSGTLVDRSAVIAPRVARPTLILSVDDAQDLGLVEGDHARVTTDNRAFIVAVAVVEMIDPGLALLRGVPFFPGRVAAEIEKLEIAEKEMVV